MKTIIVNSLKYQYFKGLVNKVIEFSGVNARLFGDNATFKTTTFDGFLWLLFDKDSNNDSKFAIQTLDKSGKKIHNLEHVVEGEFLIDGVPLQLKKVYKEKWTKKRGQAHQEFSGYTTDHFIDEVPVAKKEYDKRINEIVTEDIFKLLTSPTYFNENVKWQDRRKVLFEVAGGDISDQDVIAANPDLSQLNEVLSGKTVEDIKKIIASKKKHINDELSMIPVRIDELTKAVPELLGDPTVLKTEISELESQIDALKEQRSNVLNGGALREKQNELKDLQSQLQLAEREFNANSNVEVQQLTVRVQEAQGNVQIIKADIRNNNFEKDQIENEIKQITSRISDNESQMSQLRAEFNVINTLNFEYDDNCECPTCKQALPAEQLQAARDEALAQFNQQNSKRKLEIKEKGTSLSAINTELNTQIAQLHEKLNNTVLGKLSDLQMKLDAAEKELHKFSEKLQQAKTTVPDFKTSEQYAQFQMKIGDVQTMITTQQSNATEVIREIEMDIATIEQQKREKNAELGQFDFADKQKIRIAELEKNQKKLAEEYEQLEANLFLAEEFTRKKVSMLEERINSKFKYARFKLFEEQVNGGLNEVCETMFEGVPYGTGLNNAAKINVGLDIINTLSEHYGIKAPIFVDNAEAVTKFIDVNTQLISLVVSEQDKELRIELEPVEYKEAI